MKSESICFPCFVEQAHSTVQYATRDEDKRWEVLKDTAPVLSGLDMEATPSYNSTLVLHKVYDLLGEEDPYKDAKRESNEKALQMVPSIMDRIRASQDKLEAAVRLSVAGNVIDLGIKHDADLEETMDAALGEGFTRFDYEAFKDRLSASSRILYLLDNAGEIVFDKILIEGLKAHGKMVLAAVKGGPILNDATMADAEQVGLEKVVKVMDTGSNWVGVVREKCSDVFLKALDSADMVIAKGQGNYETLDQEGERFFFILKAKCPHVANALGIQKDEMALVQGS